MRIPLRWLAIFGVLGTAGPVHASYDLAMQKKCVACHQVDKRKNGPSFKEIAAKYAGQDAAEILAEKIRRGGTGVWGEDVMPPQPQVSAAEARALALYVLSLK